MNSKVKFSGDENVSTDGKILMAAWEVFIEKGFDGARMQEIAEIAGINKALLHYYFRSKDKLFMAVFESAIKKIIPSLTQILTRQGSLKDKLKDFFSVHMGFLIENPAIPRFVVSEMSGNHERLSGFFEQFKEMDVYSKFDKMIKDCISSGEIEPIEPTQLLLNLVSLSVFPIMAGPMLRGILNLSKSQYQVILEERKNAAAEFTINSIFSK